MARLVHRFDRMRLFSVDGDGNSVSESAPTGQWASTYSIRRFTASGSHPHPSRLLSGAAGIQGGLSWFRGIRPSRYRLRRECEFLDLDLELWRERIDGDCLAGAQRIQEEFHWVRPLVGSAQ